jgi:DNA-binding phage protein
MGKTHRHGAAMLKEHDKAARARARRALKTVIADADMSYTTVAKVIGRATPFMTKILAEDHNVTVKTMARVFAACGYELDFTATKIEKGEKKEDLT